MCVYEIIIIDLYLVNPNLLIKGTLTDLNNSYCLSLMLIFHLTITLHRQYITKSSEKLLNFSLLKLSSLVDFSGQELKN